MRKTSLLMVLYVDKEKKLSYTYDLCFASFELQEGDMISDISIESTVLLAQPSLGLLKQLLDCVNGAFSSFPKILIVDKNTKEVLGSVDKEKALEIDEELTRQVIEDKKRLNEEQKGSKTPNDSQS